MHKTRLAASSWKWPIMIRASSSCKGYFCIHNFLFKYLLLSTDDFAIYTASCYQCVCAFSVNLLTPCTGEPLGSSLSARMKALGLNSSWTVSTWAATTRPGDAGPWMLGLGLLLGGLQSASSQAWLLWLLAPWYWLEGGCRGLLFQAWLLWRLLPWGCFLEAAWGCFLEAAGCCLSSGSNRLPPTVATRVMG
jgi:hypothetical protein